MSTDVGWASGDRIGGGNRQSFMDSAIKTLGELGDYLKIYPIGSMGRWMVYLYTYMNVDFYGFHAGKCTSPMDPMGI